MPQKMPPLVLIVDDSSDIRESLAFLLGDAGYRVTTAASGHEALARVRAERPDVMITDMIMPGMGGLELLVKLRSDFAPPVPPVIACSGFSATAEEALRHGAFAFLAKPVSPDLLLDSLVAALGGQRPSELTVDHERERLIEARSRAHRAAASTLEHIDGERLAVYGSVLVNWLSEYFECPSVLILLLRPAGLEVLSSTDSRYPAGLCIERTLSYATDIIETGSTLLLPDVTRHPSFASHSEATRGVRSFAGVPIFADRVAIGAICFFDRRGRAFDAEELLLFEHLGRRTSIGLERLAAKRPVYRYSMATIPGLVREEAFVLLLGVELQLGQRYGDAIEMAIVELADTRSIASATEVLRKLLPHERLAMAALGPSRLAIFKRGPDLCETSRQMSTALEGLSGDVLAAGRVAVDAVGTAPLAQEVLLIASRAVARALAEESGAERIVVRSEAPHDVTSGCD